MWGEIITYIAGHALSRSIFKESEEEKAARIAEERRKKRKEFWMSLLFTLIMFFVLGAMGYSYYLYLKVNNLLPQ